MDSVIYTMLRAVEWHEARRRGVYRGSEDDRRDGFLHFSTAAQLRASASKHRAGARDLFLLAVDTTVLGDALRWEPAAGGKRPGLFPHLYAPLPMAAVISAAALPLGDDGTHEFPPEIP